MKGFTLIELVVVILILGILVAVGIPKYVDLTAQAKQAADRSQLHSLRTSVNMLQASNLLAGLTGTNQWPSAASVWANLTKTNTWQYYTNVTYRQTNGTWVVAGIE